MLDQLLSLVAPRFCIACGADAGAHAPLCQGCRTRLGAPRIVQAGATRCWTAFSYDGPAGALVRSLKFGGRAGLADAMAAQLAARAPSEWLGGAVVPVPVHPAHRRRRGVDHTHLLAAALARRIRRPLADCLTRAGDPRPQVGRSRTQRIMGPLGLIQARAAPQAVLLVDDVVTTGATIAACAAALRRAGSQEITAVAYARTTAR